MILDSVVCKKSDINKRVSKSTRHLSTLTIYYLTSAPASITPIFKKGDRQSPANYQSVYIYSGINVHRPVINPG